MIRPEILPKLTGSDSSWDWRIIHGDCLEVLPTLESGSARLIFADPPYNQGIDYGDGTDADSLFATAYLDWCRRWIDACVPLLAADGSMAVLMPHEWQAHVYLMLSQAGLHWRDTITWHETFGVNCTRRFSRTSRLIHHFTKHPIRFVFNADAVRVPSDRQLKYNDSRANPAGKVPGDVWEIPRVCGTFKERLPGVPTQLPVDLLRRVIVAWSDPGDLVLDPFSGTATTGAATLPTGRSYVGIERSYRYCEVSRRRLTTHAGADE